MKKIIIILLIIFLFIGLTITFSKSIEKEPKELVAKFSFDFSSLRWKDEKKIDEKLLFFIITPAGLAIKEDHLYVSDTGNNRIQVLKIDPDGSLHLNLSLAKKARI